MSWKEFNGGDETEWYHVVILLFLMGVFFGLIFFLGGEPSEF